VYRYYKNHFKDSVRQCCLDIMHGVRLSEILPDEPPSYTPHIALQQEFEFANVLYQMSRSVSGKCLC
jgi:hypothetical protein